MPEHDDDPITRLNAYGISAKLDQLITAFASHAANTAQSLNRIDANIEALGNGRFANSDQLSAWIERAIEKAFSDYPCNAMLDGLGVERDPFASPPGQDYQDGAESREIPVSPMPVAPPLVTSRSRHLISAGTSYIPFAQDRRVIDVSINELLWRENDGHATTVKTFNNEACTIESDCEALIELLTDYYPVAPKAVQS